MTFLIQLRIPMTRVAIVSAPSSSKTIMIRRSRFMSSSSPTSTASISSSSSSSMETFMLAKIGFPSMLNKLQNPYATAGKWILGTAGLVVGMIQIGALTRLTQSGLSMVDWNLTGSLPPLTESAWNEEFQKYQQYPEFQQRKSMTLSEFKYIYAWEYGHRMFGRVIGIAFIGPWIYLSIRKKIPSHLQPRMALLGTMGLTQGLVGWWMVKSGLGDDRRNDKKEIRVQPQRLATHLSLAVATYSVLLWTAFDLFKLPHTETLQSVQKSIANEIISTSSNNVKGAIKAVSRLRVGAIGVTGLTALTIVSGALVAGNDAGRAYNTFPKFGDDWYPSLHDYLNEKPWYKNFITNTATVQFNHRMLGGTTAFTAIYLALKGLYSTKLSSSSLLTPQVRRGLLAVGLAGAGQYTLGVTTLLYYVPISLAAMHQMGSIILLSSGIYLVHSFKYILSPRMIRAVASRTTSTTARIQ